MFDYARSDTHFLLYIYDNMRNELIEKSKTSQEDGDLIGYVMNRSKEETLQRYERPFYDIQRGSGPMGWYNMLCRTPALFDREQFAVFRAVHQWRDQIAREEDESVHVIMPKHVLYNLARELPVDIPALLGCSHPITKTLKNRKSEILAIIAKARRLGYKGPDMKELMQTLQPMTGDRFSKANGAEPVAPAFADVRTALPSQLQRNSNRLPAQSSYSRFWGSTIPINKVREAIIQEPGENLCLALPMPRLTAEIFEDTTAAGANANEPSQTSPGARADHQYVKNRKAKIDEVFIVKNAGGPSKRKATDSNGLPKAVYLRPEGSAAGNSQEPAEEVEALPINNKDEQRNENTKVSGETIEGKRARRIESKRQKKEQGNEDKGNQRPKEVEPFDYANAPSILHAQRDSYRMARGKEINPYTKSSDAPKGIRTAKREQEGKSFTFKG